MSVLLKTLSTFEILGLQFAVSKTEANDTVHDWLKILRMLLPASLVETVASDSSDDQSVQAELRQLQLIVDSFEQARELSSTRRIFVEHGIRLLRIFHITKERFRLHPSTYEQIILTVCGLVRFRPHFFVESGVNWGEAKHSQTQAQSML